jgi:hypothetical protein
VIGRSADRFSSEKRLFAAWSGGLAVDLEANRRIGLLAEEVTSAEVV